METKADGDHFAVITNRSNKPIVMTQQIIVESFGIRIGFRWPDDDHTNEQGRHYHLAEGNNGPATLSVQQHVDQLFPSALALVLVVCYCLVRGLSCFILLLFPL